MTVEVALAMLQREGRWLMQLRDDFPGIVAPGCWGLFGGHLDAGESPEEALRRELLEEISQKLRSRGRQHLVVEGIGRVCEYSEEYERYGRRIDWMGTACFA